MKPQVKELVLRERYLIYKIQRVKTVLPYQFLCFLHIQLLGKKI